MKNKGVNLFPNITFHDDIIGLSRKNNDGELMTIIDKYSKGTPLVTVKFQETGWERKDVNFRNFKIGSVKDLYYPVVYGVGYVGETKTKEKGKHYTSYICWRSMLSRCYNPKDKSYRWYGAVGCRVCNEWLCYKNFKQWYDKNFYTIGDETVNLEKDLLFKNNNIYSPESCIFSPQKINKAIINAKINRGDLPIGVYRNHHNSHKKYAVQICYGDGISKQLGGFETIEEAFNKYKTEKEKYLKELAEEYKKYIPQKLYNALYSYKIEYYD